MFFYNSAHRCVTFVVPAIHGYSLVLAYVLDMHRKPQNFQTVLSQILIVFWNANIFRTNQYNNLLHILVMLFIILLGRL